ncbi:hypothetical protein BGZ94_004445 [Podila epigama]|nr:hypothetical protein BGZ94_004445 [Podila epigama]
MATAPASKSAGRVTKKTPPSKSKSVAGSGTTSSSASSASSPYAGQAKGIAQLPAARVKRIIKEDKEIAMVSNDAVFLISMATELFLGSFATKAFNLAKMEKRKTVSYKDLATAVSQHDSLEFLQDLVPKTMPLSAALKKQQEAKENEETNDGMEEDEASASVQADENNDGGSSSSSRHIHNGDDLSEDDQAGQSHGGSDARSDTEDKNDSSRPMSEDETLDSEQEDMDQD